MEQSLLNILQTLRERSQNNSRNRRPQRNISEDDEKNLSEDQYNKMVEQLYKITLPLDQTIINKEEHDDLELLYQDTVSAKIKTEEDSDSPPQDDQTKTEKTENSSSSSLTFPLSSLIFEYQNRNGSSDYITMTGSSNPLLFNHGFGTGSTSNYLRGQLFADMMPNMNTILQDFMRTFLDTGEQPKPLSKDIFDSFKEVPYDELKNHTNIDLTDNCSICLSGFINNETEENRKATVIPCGHYFHKTCIKEWLTKCHYKCPLCKKSCDPARRDDDDDHKNDNNDHKDNDDNDKDNDEKDKDSKNDIIHHFSLMEQVD